MIDYLIASKLLHKILLYVRKKQKFGYEGVCIELETFKEFTDLQNKEKYMRYIINWCKQDFDKVYYQGLEDTKHPNTRLYNNVNDVYVGHLLIIENFKE